MWKGKERDNKRRRRGQGKERDNKRRRIGIREGKRK